MKKYFTGWRVTRQ